MLFGAMLEGSFQPPPLALSSVRRGLGGREPMRQAETPSAMRGDFEEGAWHMPYTIQSHGDMYEQRFYPYLAALFPNYEAFWRDVIVPMTMRDIDGQVWLRPGVARDLELLSMSHYSCYYHLGVAHELLTLLNERPYLCDDSFLHLEAALALVDRFLRDCGKVWRDLFSTPRDHFFTTLRTDNWRSKKSCFDALSVEVGLYRNAIAHDPKLGQIVVRADGTIWIPRSNKLPRNNPPTWSEIASFKFPDEFEDLKVLVDRLKTEVPNAINDLWPEILDEFLKLSQTNEDYQMMACIGKFQPSSIQVVTATVGVAYPSNLPTSASGIKIEASSGSANIPH